MNFAAFEAIHTNFDPVAGRKIFGGPDVAAAAEESKATETFLVSRPTISDVPIAFTVEASSAELVTTEQTFARGNENPLGVAPSRDGIIIYRVQKGDTLSKIASSFGVSVNTIVWANSGIQTNKLSLGQELAILPVSGVLHVADEGETLEGIAGSYGVSVEKVLSANPKSVGTILARGEKVMIPGGEPKRLLAKAREDANLPSLPGYFAFPTTGKNWAQIHPVNAVDIANACGTPIYAAAEGLVVDVGNPATWNDGYGGFITIEHPNGTKTLYAHTEKNLAAVGDYVAKKQLIAEIGSTGNVSGATGCHLHFEVHGAKNPLAK